MNDSSENTASHSDDGPSESTTANPTPYHHALLRYLKTHEVELWKWFSSQKARDEYSEAVRLDLLKTTYRIDRQSAAELYEIADKAAATMGVAAKVTLYQAQHATSLNASLAWLPNEAHVVLHGPVQETLQLDELTALLVHELAHHELYTIANGEYLVVEHILYAMIGDQEADAPHLRTWRSYKLWTELYCDRRAAQITDNIDACVCALVKMETGLKDVSAAAYLSQADEVLAKGSKGSKGMTHPEMFIRAKALQLWHEDSSTVDDIMRKMVQGPLELNTLDLLQQRDLQLLTEQFVRTFLQPPWLHTDLILGHAHRFLDVKGAELRPSASKMLGRTSSEATEQSKREVVEAVQRCDAQLKNFFCYVLLDFVTCDPDLEEAPLAAAFLFAEQVGLLDEFRTLVASELKLGKRALQSAEKDARKTVRVAEQEFVV